MLKKRLETVAELIEDDTLIDIGTDHGYLIIDLFKQGKLKHALAVEIADGPLSNVIDNVNRSQITNVKFALSDGLKNVEPMLAHQYQGISICGMGGNLIAKIISESMPLFRYKTLYLQPNNKEQHLRQFLSDNHFKIVDEKVVYDNGIYYEILKVIDEQCELTDKEIYFGPINLQTKSKSWQDKQRDQLAHLYRVKTQLINNRINYQKIEDEIKFIEEGLNETT